MTNGDDWSRDEPIYRQRWQDDSRSPLPMSGMSGLGERLARVEEGLRHTVDQTKTTGDRLHAISNRFMANEVRLTTLETEGRRLIETVSKLEPLASDYQRRKDRKQILKDAINWLTVPAVAYLAFSGKASMADVLGAFAKMFGAH